MTDEEILSRLGLSHDHASGLLQAANCEPTVAPAPTTSSELAAAALGDDCTAADVERFVSARVGNAPGTALIFYAPQAVADEDADLE